jgi:hypothetical protein
MGEGANGLSAVTTQNGGNEDTSPRATARQLEAEIAVLREELSGLVGELDRRRHELLDVKLQVKRHAVGVALTGVALVSAASGLVWLGAWRAQRRARVLSRAGRLREAVSRIIDKPERVAAEATIPGKIFTAAATAAVATLVKKGLERAVNAALEKRRVRSETVRPTAARRPAAASMRSESLRETAVIDAVRPDATLPPRGHPGAAAGTSVDTAV